MSKELMYVSRIHIARVPPVWRALAWVGSLGLGLTAFFSFASRLHFEYHSFKDIVATSAFAMYPESQDLWLYLLGLVIIPLFTLIGRGIWVGHIMLAQKIQGQDEQSDVAFITLTYLLWWVRPLTYAYSHQPGAMSVYAIGGLFVLGNGMFVAQRWLQRRALSNPADAPPTLGLQGAISLLGVIIGVSLLTSPIGTPVLQFPAQTVLGMVIGLWGFWLGGTYLLSRILRRDWQITSECISVGCLPLSMLSIQGVLWWEVYQGGQQVARYGSSETATLLFPVTAVAIAVAMFWALYYLVNKRRKVAWTRLFWRWFWLLTVPLLLYALVYNPNIHQRLDLFHEGERVAPAQAMIAGRIPYRDVVFVHGFLRDPGVALVAFRLFGSSVAGLRMLERLLVPLVLVATYYLALLCLGRRWALLYSCLALTGFWPFFYGWRMVPLIITLACLVLYVRQRRMMWAVCGSFFTFLSIAISIDIGLVALFAGITLAVAFSLVEWRKVKFSLFLGYFLPILICTTGIMLYLVFNEALDPFLAWNWHIITVSRDWNGMPFPLPPGNMSQMWESFLSPLATVVAILMLSLSTIRKRWSERDWIVLLLLVANLILYNRGLVGGQLHSSHLWAGSHFGSLLLLTIFFPRRSSTVRENLTEVITIAMLILALLLPTPTHPSTGRSLLDVINGLPAKNRVQIPASWTQSDVERVGPIFLPSSQESSLTEIVDFLSTAESFWDFTDHGALYFLSDHLSPTRFYATHHVITRENQQEVIASLTESPPRYVLFRSGTGWDAIAGIDRTLRNFLVSEYLLKNYHFMGQVGGFTVLEEGASHSFPQPLAFRVDLGYVPFLWGRDRVYDLEALDPASVVRWSFSSTGNLGGWQPAHDVVLSEVSEEGWYISTEGSDAQLQNLDLVLDPRSVTYLALQMRTNGTTGERIKAQLFWRSGNEEFAEERSFIFNVVPDGQEHVYLLRMASFPGWAWRDTITGLRLDPINTSGANITINAIELFQVDELRTGSEQ